MQCFIVTLSRQNKVYKDKFVEYVVGVEGTLTNAMALQKKTPGSKISVQNY